MIFAASLAIGCQHGVHRPGPTIRHRDAGGSQTFDQAATDGTAQQGRDPNRAQTGEQILAGEVLKHGLIQRGLISQDQDPFGIIGHGGDGVVMDGDGESHARDSASGVPRAI